MIVNTVAPRGKDVSEAVRKLVFQSEDAGDERVLAALAARIIESPGAYRELLEKLLKA